MRRGFSSETLLRRRLWVAVAALDTGAIWLWSSSSSLALLSNYRVQDFSVNELWRTAVQMVGEHLLHHAPIGLICNAVVVARIMNATLVLPELDTNSFWHDKSGFEDLYDVPHFIKTLKYDVRIVRSLPNITAQGKTKKLKADKIDPPRDAPAAWYRTTALEKIMKCGAIYLTPFSHRLPEEIDDPELQRLRCRVNYHALQFKPNVRKIRSDIVNKLRSEGHFMSIHLRFELDMLAYAGCIDIFTPKEEEILLKYREENFAEKKLVYRERRLIGKCPLTPEEVLILLNYRQGWSDCAVSLARDPCFCPCQTRDSKNVKGARGDVCFGRVERDGTNLYS